MTDRDSIESAIQREMLQVALRNSARSVPLLIVAVLFLAWLGWKVNAVQAAAVTLLMGLVVAAWRWWMNRSWGGAALYSPQQTSRLMLEMEANGVLAGLMWVVSTVFIYPQLQGTEASVYAVMVCGSVALAAVFMSMVGRGFVLLAGLQMGSLAYVSVASESARSIPLAVLSTLFGFTMFTASRPTMSARVVTTSK